jgi:hypothetical protein
VKTPVPRDDSPGPAQRVLRFALMTPLDWALTLIACFVVAAGGLFLTLAWQIGPEVALRHQAYAKLTAASSARIVESWVALELDPARVPNPEFWRASARVSPCVIVEIEGAWSADRGRAFCGNRFKFNDAYDIVALKELAPGVRFAWRRDERGFAVPEIRMSTPARDYLATHAADTFMHRAWPARNALDWLRLEADRPVDSAVIGWTAPPSVMRVVYDPQKPELMLPAGIVQARSAARSSWILALLAGALGLGAWVFGMQLLPALRNFNALGRVVLTLAPLVALPWWADYLPAGLAYFSRPLGEVVQDMLADFDPLDRLVATSPDAATLAGGVRMAWRAGDGPYADSFGRFRFAPPATPFASDDAALAALADSVTQQMHALSEADRIARFDAWRHEKQGDLLAAGVVGLPAAREVLLDRGADGGERRAARAFLLDWTTSPYDEADPHRPAFAERQRLWASLADVPVPEIANMVKAR